MMMLLKSKMLGKLFFVMFGWLMIIYSCQSFILYNWGFQGLVIKTEFPAKQFIF
jgi:hypothetical protein